jgi:hypothetical protein
MLRQDVGRMHPSGQMLVEDWVKVKAWAVVKAKE